MQCYWERTTALLNKMKKVELFSYNLQLEIVWAAVISLLDVLDSYGETRAPQLIFKTSCEYIYCTEMYEGADNSHRADTEIILAGATQEGTKMIMFDLSV